MAAAAQEALGGFGHDGNQMPVRAVSGWFLALLGAFAGEIFLFLIYLALPVGLGVGLAWYCSVGWQDAVAAGSGSAADWLQKVSAFGQVLLPVSAGWLLVLLLLKPFLADKAKEVVAVEMLPDAEPELEQFLREFCRRYEAPFPKRISMTCEAEVRADFVRGAGGLPGKDIELVIGLPLVSGMEVRAFGGILARELGYGARGSKRSMEWILRAMHEWLFKAVYGRDAWDRRIDAARTRDEGAGEPGQFTFLAGCGEALVWLMRRPLWVLLRASEAICAPVLRRAEAEADGRLIDFAGTQWFRDVEVRRCELEEGCRIARKQVVDVAADESLPRDFPSLAVLRANLLPEDHGAAAWHGLGKDGYAERRQPVRLSPEERESQLAGGPVMGWCDRATPATSLFGNYGVLCEEVSRRFYRENLGLEVVAGALARENRQAVPRAHRLEVSEGVVRVFGSKLYLLLPVVLPGRNLGFLGMATPLLRERFVEDKRRVSDLMNLYAQVVSSAADAEMRCLAAMRGEMLLENGIAIEPAAFGLIECDRETARGVAAQQARRLGVAEAAAADFTEASRKLLRSTFSLLARPDLYPSDTGGCAAALEELGQLIRILHQFGELRPHVVRLRRHLSMLDGLFEVVQQIKASAAGPSHLVERMRHEAEAAASERRTILCAAKELTCPFADEGAETAGDYLARGEGAVYGGEGPCDDVAFASQEFRRGYAFHETLTEFYHRTMERVAFYVEAVEWIVGREGGRGGGS